MLRYLVLSTFSCALISPGLQAQSKAPATKPPKSALPFKPLPPPTDQEQFLPYWTTEVGWDSAIQLRNNLTSVNLTVTPVLRSPDGTETALQPVIVSPKTVSTVHIAAAVSGVAPQLLNAYGSVVLRYKSATAASLWSMVMIHGIGHPFAFHIDPASLSPDLSAGSREGVWWLPQETTSDFLILTNLGADPLTLTLSVYDQTGKELDQTVALPPRAMNRYSVQQLAAAAGLTGTYGGVRVSASAHAGALSTLHFLFDQAAGFSALLKMFDHDPSAQLSARDFAHTGAWTLRAPMLPLTTPDPALGFPPGTALQPQLFIRNTTSSPLDAALSFGWRGPLATGKAAGPSLHLGPNQTVRLDVGALQQSGTIPQNANWTSVTISTNGPPDSIMAVAASYNSTLAYGAQTPFSDQLAFHWVGSLWEYDAQHDSLITTGNGGTKPVLADFVLYYEPGAQTYEMQQTLQPGDQMWVDVGQLIREHVPDMNGKLLPATVTSGTYEIRDLTNRDVGALFEGKVVFDKTYGSATYGCAGCCGWSRTLFSLYYDPLDIPLEDQVWQGVQGYDDCSQDYEDASDFFYYGWDTANHSIATVDSYGNHTGMGVGSTTTHAVSQPLEVEDNPNRCQLVARPASGNDNTTPNITSISPTQGLIGTTVYVTISGSGFGSSPTVNAGTGIGVTINYVSADGTEIQAYFKIFAAATGGNQAVTVTNGNQTSNAVNFFVQIPTSLSIVPGTDSTTSESSCDPSGGGSGCGVTRSFIYQVDDQIGKPIQAAGIQVWDAISTTSPNNLYLTSYATTCTPANTGPCNVTTDGSGQFGENNPGLAVCAPVCRMNNACVHGGPTNANQTWHVGSYSIVQNLSYNCDHITVNGS